MKPIPVEELNRLMQGIAEAFQLAARGHVQLGYGLLSDGLFRSRSLDSAWAPEMAQLWALALAHYIQRYPANWFRNEL
jgi:hypothetical protein